MSYAELYGIKNAGPRQRTNHKGIEIVTQEKGGSYGWDYSFEPYVSSATPSKNPFDKRRYYGAGFSTSDEAVRAAKAIIDKFI